MKSVDPESAAGIAGLREGDCLLKVAGEDVLGLKVNSLKPLLKLTSQ